MSYLEELTQKTKAELSEIAEEYGIEVARKNKTQIAEEIFKFESGVSSQVEIKPTQEEKPKDNLEDLQLIKFTGTNNVFHVSDYAFTRKNPFLAVPARIASHVYRKWPNKFRPASPDEVKEFYS